jgi:murein DD-endopeptidase MepM/ murein hydrolase activator NlpD
MRRSKYSYKLNKLLSLLTPQEQEAFKAFVQFSPSYASIQAWFGERNLKISLNAISHWWSATQPSLEEIKIVTGEGLGRRSPERNHHGVDIAAPLGTPVVASADGIAKVAVNPGGYGNFVELTHAGGIRTIYGHLSSASVKTGQQVKQGQEIGRCGSTGRSTGPHLHFQIMKNGQAIPPSAVGITIPPKHRSGFRY